MNLINDRRTDIVIVFSADHVYRMDPRQMIDQHASNASAA
jgi:glucose-1-phosphate adenylyltransferase